MEDLSRLDSKVALGKDDEGVIAIATLDRMTGEAQGKAKRLSREEAQELYRRLGVLLGP